MDICAFTVDVDESDMETETRTCSLYEGGSNAVVAESLVNVVLRKGGVAELAGDALAIPS